MFKVSDDDILMSTNNYSSFYRAEINIPFTEKKFLDKALPKLSKEVGRKYPYQVRIPKSIRELTEGDLEPARIIEIEKPMIGEFGEMWFGDATTGIRLLAGYKNGDSRYICTNELGDKDIHGLLAGSTGQGKSVTLNAFIYGMCYLYAPWELNLTLCDAKIVEFKTIAVNNPMPQITAVAATEDADYLISVLDTKQKEMMAVNKMYSAVGNVIGKDVRNIADFRKSTGMVLPQNVIIIDEFQTMFKGAPKKVNQIIEILDSFARLGRNTGYHLLMASQEIGSELPAGMLTNIKLRLAMGCFSNVSEKVLGNPDAALNMGKRGHMIINNEPAAAKNSDYNVQYRVPFPDGTCTHSMAAAVRQQGEKLQWNSHMNFYDENDLVQEEQLEDYLRKQKVTPNELILGEPSCIMPDGEEVLKLQYTGEKFESVSVIAPTDETLARYIKLFKANLAVAGGSQSIILCAHPVLARSCHLQDFALPKFFFNEPQYEDNDFFNIMRSIIYKRKVMLKADEFIFNGVKQRSDQWDALFDKHVGKSSEMDNDLNRERFAQCLAIMCTDKQMINGLHLGNDGKVTTTHLKLAASCIKMYCDYGVRDIQLTLKSIPILYFWIVGLDSIVGLGRMSKSKFVTELKSMINDSSYVNVRVLSFTTTYTDLTEFCMAIRWFIYEGVSGSEIGKTKCECYPDTVLSKLAVVFDSTKKQDGCFKFKKIVQTGEIL